MGAAEARQAQREADLTSKYGHGLGALEGTFAPLLAGAARGLSIGTSDSALIGAARSLGGDAAGEAMRQRLLDYQEFGSVASTGGELGAIGLAAALGDEAALSGATRAVGRLGLGAERLAAGALGEGSLARGAGVLARGAVEGGVYGAGGAVSESALHDTPLTAEALVGGASHGALGGMVATGLTEGALSGLRALRGVKPSAAGYEGLAAATYGEAAPGVGKVAAEDAAATNPYRTTGPRGGVYDTAADAYIGNPLNAPSQQEKLAETWANRERVFSKHAETVENASRDFSQSLDEVLQRGNATDVNTFGEAKKVKMAGLVDQARFVQQSDATINWLADAQKVINDLNENPLTKMTLTARNQWDGHMSAVAKAIESGQGARVNSALDDMKRFLGRQSGFGRSEWGLTGAQREFDRLYKGDRDGGIGLQQLLESEVWGKKAADAQKYINASTHQMLSDGENFTSKFTKQRATPHGRPEYAADTRAVDSFMNQLTSPANDFDARSVDAYIQARKGYLDAVSTHYDYGAAGAKNIAAERKALGRMEQVVKQTTKDVSLANQVRGALQEEHSRGIGGAIGAVFDIASKPYTTLQRLAQIEGHTRSVVEKLTGRTKALVSEGGTKAAAEKPSRTSPGFFSALLGGMGKVASKGAPGIGAVGSRVAFEEKAEALGAVAGNPAMVTERIGQALGPLGSAAPKTTQAATMIALKGLDYLASKLPPSRMDQYSLQPQLQVKNRASDAEISSFMRSAEAIDDPLIVLREAKAGTLTRDHVEAVKNVYPALYDRMRAEVMTSVVDSKTELPYSKRIQLGILLDIPTDKTLSPDFVRAIQATYSDADKAGVESPPQNVAPPDIAGSAQTATQQAVERAQ
jgi:hypothetical protein